MQRRVCPVGLSRSLDSVCKLHQLEYVNRLSNAESDQVRILGGISLLVTLQLTGL
jgi:hypothetical protein